MVNDGALRDAKLVGDVAEVGPIGVVLGHLAGKDGQDALRTTDGAAQVQSVIAGTTLRLLVIVR